MGEGAPDGSASASRSIFLAAGPRALLLLAAAALALLAGARSALALWDFYAGEQRLPLWDMAGHGFGGAELLAALRDFSPLSFLASANAQDTWPFGFSLWLLPFLAAGDAGFAAATAASTLLFALVPALLVRLAAEVEEGSAAAWSGLAAAACWLASPQARVHAVLVMRETAGAALTVLALALWLAAVRRGTLGAWRRAGLVLLGLFFVKYNYAVLLGAGLAVDGLLGMEPEARRRLLRAAFRRLWPGRGAPIAAWLGAAAALGLAAAAAAGINIGVALYLALLAATVTLGRELWRDRAGVRARLAALEPRTRGLAEALVAPLWLWALSPSPLHLKSLFAFLRNRSGDAGGFAGGGPGFYLQTFPAEHAGRIELGWGLLALAALGFALVLARPRRVPAPYRTLVLAAGVGLLLVSLHPYKDPRFLFTVAPLLALAAAAVPGVVLAGLPAGGARTLLRHGLGALVAALAAWPLSAPAGAAERLGADYAQRSSAPRYAVALEQLAASSRPGERVAYLGTCNELSESLVRWRLVQLRSSARVVDGPRRFAAELPPAEARARLARWRAAERPDRIVALRIFPGSPIADSLDYQRYNAWQRTALAALLEDPAWRLAARHRVSALRLEVLELVPRGAAE